MKKLGIILLSLCLTMVVFNFGDTSSAKATSYLTAEQQLDEYEHAVYEAIITMLPRACREPNEYYSDTYENGGLLPGDPSEYRLLEAQYEIRENAADLACVRFVRVGEQGGIVEMYYLLQIETYETEEAVQADHFVYGMSITTGNSYTFFDLKCGHIGNYQPVSLNSVGVEGLATTRDSSFVRRINQALDEYWGAQ